MRIVILFGSEMGTSEGVAECLADEFPAHEVSVYDMFDFDPGDLDPSDFHIIVCSTYGDGELPTGAEPFFKLLESTQPDLTGLRFVVFGLGDTIYGDSFNRGGEIAAELLIACGADQVGDHARHDASTPIRAKDMAREWARTLPIPALQATQAGHGTA
ncbi:flavodoxin domain-containing protein [Nocardia heshunensis]